MEKRKTVIMPMVPRQLPSPTLIPNESRNNNHGLKLGILSCKSGTSRISSKFNLSPNQGNKSIGSP